MSESLAERSTRALLSAYAEQAASPGAGSAVALAAATAAALLVRCANAATRADLAVRASALQDVLVRAADEDALAVDALVRATKTPVDGDDGASLLAASKPPAAIADAAEQLADLAQHLVAEVPPRLRGEAEIAHMLAAVCATAAHRIIELNQFSIDGDDSDDRMAIGCFAASSRAGLRRSG